MRMMRWLLLAWLLALWAAPASAQLPTGMPDFCASPTETADTTGNWTTGSNWADNSAPGASAVIVIPSGITITYDSNTATAYKAICVESGGTFRVTKDSNTTLRVSELIIEHGGTMDWGTEASPVTATAIIEFSGTLDAGTVGSPGTDPDQFGVGLVGMGTVSIHGAVKTPYLRLTAALAASATSASLASVPTNWNSGDAWVLPDSTQRTFGNNVPYEQTSCGGTYCTYDDRGTFSANVTTTTATFSAITNAHPCGLNALDACEYYPHILNVTRNVILRSVSPGGVRGHVMLTHMATVDIRYAQFEDLGRTTIGTLHCTLLTTGAAQGSSDCVRGTGAITQIGTNQKGRYALHLHHLWGPENIPNTGYQFRIIGNAIIDSTKWPMAVHMTSHGLIQNNVVAYGNGPGIFLEGDTVSLTLAIDGNHFNTIDGNFVTGMSSTVSPREGDGTIASAGRESAGIWARGGANNTITNNIAAGLWNSNQQIITEVGFKLFIAPAGDVARIPDFRGADLTDADDYTTQDLNTVPILTFANNEAYGLGAAATIWHLGTDGYVLESGQAVSTITNLVAWNFYENGFFGYPIYNFVFDGMVCRGDRTKLNGSTRFPMCWTPGDYKNHTITIRNLNAQGMAIAIGDTIGSDGPLVYENSITKAAFGIVIGGFYAPGSGHSPITARTTTITNVVHTTLTGHTNRPIVMEFDRLGGCCGGHFHADTLSYTTTVNNYQGASQSFDLYFLEQESNSYAGGLAPCTDDTSLPEVVGLVCNIRSAGRFRLRIRGTEDLWQD